MTNSAKCPGSNSEVFCLLTSSLRLLSYPCPSFLPSSRHLWDPPTSSLQSSEGSHRHWASHTSRIPTHVPLARRLCSHAEKRDNFYRIARFRNQIYTRTRTPMAANVIQGNLIYPDHLGHHPVAEVLRMVSKSRDICWGKAEHGSRVWSECGGDIVRSSRS